jgi:hypothetical protein
MLLLEKDLMVEVAKPVNKILVKFISQQFSQIEIILKCIMPKDKADLQRETNQLIEISQ